MGQAAYQKTINVSDDGGSTNAEAPANTGNLNQGGDVLDDTEMSLSHAFRSRLYGLRDWSVDMTLEYEPGSSTAFQILRDAWLNRNNVFVQYLPDGTIANGFEGSTVVETFNMSGEVGGKETVEVTLQADGELSAAS